MSLFSTPPTARMVDETTPVPSVEIVGRTDATRTMKVVEYFGKRSVDVVEEPVPLITNPKDAIVRITATAICGSDLHLYNNFVQGMKKGDSIGHEFMGIVESVGSEVETIRPGMRVVVAFPVADGTCEFCKRGAFTLCETTNDSKFMNEMYGHRTGGIYGYSHLLGGYQGGQGEYNRVPYADVGLLPVPDHLKDEQVLFLSDIVPTSFHATELAAVKEGDTVGIWGAGPIGLLSAMWCKWKKAKRIIIVDNVPDRLDLARKEFGAETINFAETPDVIGKFQEICPGGPDSVIDATGFRYSKTLASKIQMNLMLETDSSDVLNECIKVVKKGGNVSLIADYVGYTNQFPIGALMEKGLHVSGGQAPVQKYWHDLLKIIDRGEVDPTVIITHGNKDLEDAPHLYDIFDRKTDHCIKCVMRTPFGRQQRMSIYDSAAETKAAA